MTVGNISDAGAHGQMLCGAGQNIKLFKEFVKTTGDLIVEDAVQIQTGRLAEHFALHDRGVTAEGKRADITVFHLDEIEHRQKEKIYYAPMGNGEHTWRWTRPPAPVRLTLVNGVPTFVDGKATCERPGSCGSTRASRNLLTGASSRPVLLCSSDTSTGALPI